MAPNQNELLDTNQVVTETSPEGITTIALNRQHRRNAVDGPTAQKLYSAFIAFEDDPTQKVCVFYGMHGNFCSGFDLQEFAKLANRDGQYSGPDIAQRVDGRNCGPLRANTAVDPQACHLRGVGVCSGRRP